MAVVSIYSQLMSGDNCCVNLLSGYYDVPANTLAVCKFYFYPCSVSVALRASSGVYIVPSIYVLSDPVE